MVKFNSTGQIFWLFVTLSLLLIVTAGFLFYSLGESRDGYNLLSRESTQLDLLSDIRSTAGYVQISTLRFVIATDPDEMDKQASAIRAYYAQNGERFAKLQNYLDTDTERRLFDQAVQARLAYGNRVEQLLSLNSETLEDKLAFNIDNVRPAFDNLTNKYNDFSTEIVDIAQKRQIEAQGQINYFQTIGIILMTLAIIVILALAFLTLNIIRKLRADKVRLENETEWRKRAIVELEASNKELESFSYSVSHDLRTPLRSLEGFSQAIVEDYQDKLDEQGKRYLKRIQDASVLMGKLIDDILKLSRITRSEMTKERINLSKLAESVFSELRKNEAERQVQTIIQPNLITQGDPRLIRVVLENLIGNAWKFTGKTPSPKIEVGTINLEGVPAYFVRDNGAGFDMTYADKLFQPFQRLHKDADFPGTGIGLASVQRIIRRHGGKIWAEGKEGEGATFYFTLS